jgi:hypothetical protein
MDVIEKGFYFYLIKTNHDFFQLIKTNCPPPQSPPRWFPNREGMFIIGST